MLAEGSANRDTALHRPDGSECRRLPGGHALPRTQQGGPVRLREPRSEEEGDGGVEHGVGRRASGIRHQQLTRVESVLPWADRSAPRGASPTPRPPSGPVAQWTEQPPSRRPHRRGVLLNVGRGANGLQLVAQSSRLARTAGRLWRAAGPGREPRTSCPRGCANDARDGTWARGCRRDTRNTSPHEASLP